MGDDSGVRTFPISRITQSEADCEAMRQSIRDGVGDVWKTGGGGKASEYRNGCVEVSCG